MSDLVQSRSSEIVHDTVSASNDKQTPYRPNASALHTIEQIGPHLFNLLDDGQHVGILTSDDGGQNWRLIPLLSNGPLRERLFPTPAKALHAWRWMKETVASEAFVKLLGHAAPMMYVYCGIEIAFTAGRQGWSYDFCFAGVPYRVDGFSREGAAKQAAKVRIRLLRSLSR